MHRARLILDCVLAAALLMMTAAFAGARPLAALALLEGRTNDKAHDIGYIDWTGPVQYVYLTHKDGSWLPPDEGGAYCGSGCDEWVTRLSSGGKVSGSFASDPGTFEVNVAFSHDSSVGSAVLKACGASDTWDLYLGAGNGLPGFVSMGLTVPPGCRTWSLTASGGYVDFQAVEVYYAAPPPTPTRTATSVPSFTPSPTSTPTSTVTPSITPTPTVTPTAMPTNTPTFTPTPTDTPTSTPTDTPSPTPTPLPPQVTGQIVCFDWGDSGWCKGDESLQLVASDPQGFAVSISGDFNGSPFACADSCSVPLPEGSGVAHYTAASASGQSASGVSEWQRDATPPSLELVLPPIDGLNGWYVSALDVSANANDAVSGISVVEGRVDDGSAWGALPLHLATGFYLVEVRARDVAGNETLSTAMVRVDDVPPTSQFTSPSDGAVVKGNVALQGSLLDSLSGPASGQISMDGGITWGPVTLASGGGWSFPWDTGSTPNGTYALLVRGTDTAGNLGQAAGLTLTVDSRPPSVSLTDHWWIWETGTLLVTPDTFALATVKMTVRDPENRWPPVETDFDPAGIPTSVSWDGRLADGTRASAGDYAVMVQACDVHGLCGSDAGTISIPLPRGVTRTATPSWIPTATLTPTASVTVTPTVSPTPTYTVVVPTRVQATPVPTIPSSPKHLTNSMAWWPLVGLLALFWAVSSASLADPRPAALARLRHTILDHAARMPSQRPEGQQSISRRKEQ